jgi:predicted amidohydrolase YtcJ
MKRWLLLILFFLSACNFPGSIPFVGGSPTQARVPTIAPPPTASPEQAADVIFHSGTILTMESGQMQAQAIAVRGGKIVAVGDNAEVMALRGAETKMVYLGGRTLMPGFVDAHSHMFSEEDLSAAQETLLQNGVTTTAQMYVDEDLLAKLEDLSASGALRLRLSLYLAYNTACGESLGNWYTAYAPTREAGEMLRIGGIKIFADGGSCNVPAVTFDYPGGYGKGDLYFTTEELTPIVRDLNDAGWQIAIHTLGDRAIDVVLDAYQAVFNGENSQRHRIEHNAVLRPDQIQRYSQVNPVATIFGPFSTCAQLDEPTRFRYRVPEEHRTWEWPWFELLNANPDVHFAWHGDMPYVFTTDTLAHLYGFITRNQVRDDGTICKAPDWLAANAISADKALQLMTREAAYALFREEEVGSLTPGKYADLIILSANPLAIDPESLLETDVLMTMVGGRVEYCAPGNDALCPTP